MSDAAQCITGPSDRTMQLRQKADYFSLTSEDPIKTSYDVLRGLGHRTDDPASEEVIVVLGTNEEFSHADGVAHRAPRTMSPITVRQNPAEPTHRTHRTHRCTGHPNRRCGQPVNGAIAFIIGTRFVPAEIACSGETVNVIECSAH